MDWNWFFSSLAQSVAALVGVFSAFVISKIINNQAEFLKKIGRVRELMSISERYKEAAGLRYFEWYAERRCDIALRDLKDLLVEDRKTRLEPEAYYANLRFCVYFPRIKALELIKAEMDKYPKLTEPQVTAKHSESKSSSRGYPTHFEIALPKPDTNWAIHEAQSRQQLAESVTEEGDQIGNLLVEIRQHIRSIELHISQTETNPESSNLVKYSLICCLLLFVTGVIYPLSFLPIASSPSLSVWAFFTLLLSLKGLMLSLTFVIFSSIIIVFWSVNDSLKYDPADLTALRESSEIGYYSSFFALRETNKAQQEQWTTSEQEKTN